MQAVLRTGAHTRPALDAHERINGPSANFLVDRDGVARAGLRADTAQDALLHLVVDVPLEPARRRFGFDGVQRGLRLLEKRAEGHAPQFEASHECLPFRAADAGVDGQNDHVHVS